MMKIDKNPSLYNGILLENKYIPNHICPNTIKRTITQKTVLDNNKVIEY